MMETMGKPDKDLNEVVKHICDVMQKKIDEAYHKGCEYGKEYGLDEADMREAVSYQKGLDDAWEVVKSLFQTFGTESACVIMKNDNVHGAIDRLKAYEEQKADDEIKVGDEVDWDGVKFVVTRIFKPYNQKEQCDGVDADGSVYAAMLIENLTKTGRRFDARFVEEK